MLCNRNVRREKGNNKDTNFNMKSNRYMLQKQYIWGFEL